MGHPDKDQLPEPHSEASDGGIDGYEPPAITVLGTLAELTLGSSSSHGSDGTFTGSII
jgi:hypothetical protein